MADKDAFSDLKRAKEEEYFRQKERELIEKLKGRAGEQRARQLLSEASGIADEEILADLHELGYTRETVSLLHLVPLVYVAWAEGSVSKAERALILQAARVRGIQENTAAYTRLEEWLHQRPSLEFFEHTLRVIADLISSLPPDEQQEARSDLLTYSKRVAESSGGILGLGSKISAEENAVLAEISKAIERGRQNAVQDALRQR